MFILNDFLLDLLLHTNEMKKKKKIWVFHLYETKKNESAVFVWIAKWKSFSNNLYGLIKKEDALSLKYQTHKYHKRACQSYEKNIYFAYQMDEWTNGRIIGTINLDLT